MLHLNGRDPVSVLLKKESVIINGIEYYQHKTGNKKTNFAYDGVYYETREELMIAQMLCWMKISFLHHVNFSFPLYPDDEKEAIWCPDFILECPFRWVGEVCKGSVIVGIEAKHRRTIGRPRRKSKALLREFGIPIILLNLKDIKPYFNKKCMKLPLKPLKTYEEISSVA